MTFAQYYSASGQPGDHAPGASAAIRAEFQSVQNAFDKLPDISVANAAFLVRVNVSGTGLESFNSAGAYVPISGTDPLFPMIGTLKNTAAAAMRLVNDGGFIEAYNGAETTRTGFLQFNSAGSVLLRALAPATTGLVFQTEGGSQRIDQAGLTTHTANGSAASSVDVLRLIANATGVSLVRVTIGTTLNASNAAILGQSLSATGGALILQTAQEGTGAMTSRIHMDQFGLVGVGQLPGAGYRLDVAGTIRSIGGEAAGGYSFRALNATGNGGGSLTSLAGVNGGIVVDADGGPLLLSAGGSTRVRANSNGLVGVGRTATSKMFEVQGGIVAGISDPEALRIVNDIGYVAFWNAANGTRTGYLQGAAGSSMILLADTGNDLYLGANGFSLLRLTAAGKITENASGFELGYKGLPSTSYTGGVLPANLNGRRGFITSAVLLDSSLDNGYVATILNMSGGALAISLNGCSLIWSPSGASGARTLANAGWVTLMHAGGGAYFITGVGLS